MDRYHSTRNSNEYIASKKAILQGIAPDGGLFVSDALGKSKLDISTMLNSDFYNTMRTVLAKLLPDYSELELTKCIERAYGSQWDTQKITPLTPLGDDWLLELWHGPTGAFKDVALQLLPHLMAAARTHNKHNNMIVCATSGDTGKAALAGFADVDATGVLVLYPHNKISDIQRLQMITQPGKNLAVTALEGTFDDAQSTVKQLFADRRLADRLAQHDITLSSANSINIGRLVPQVSYYFDAYLQLLAQNVISCGDLIDFCVPTGNFGNILAGYYAQRMGCPIRRLIIASNSNDVLFDFIRTGVYDRRRPFKKTISPAMDILVSSNLERLLYYASSKDCELISFLMRKLADTGVYEVPARVMTSLREIFFCERADDAATRASIRTAWETERVLVDPHTAVGLHALDSFKHDGHVRVCLATATPYKFPVAVLSALDYTAENTDDSLACMDRLAEIAQSSPPKHLATLRRASVRFTDVITQRDVISYLEQAADRIFS